MDYMARAWSAECNRDYLNMMKVFGWRRLFIREWWKSVVVAIYHRLRKQHEYDIRYREDRKQRT